MPSTRILIRAGWVPGRTGEITNGTQITATNAAQIRTRLTAQDNNHRHHHTNTIYSTHMPGCWWCAGRGSYISGDTGHDIVELDVLRFVLPPVFSPSRDRCLLQEDRIDSYAHGLNKSHQITKLLPKIHRERSIRLHSHLLGEPGTDPTDDLRTFPTPSRFGKPRISKDTSGFPPISVVSRGGWLPVTAAIAADESHLCSIAPYRDTCIYIEPAAAPRFGGLLLCHDGVFSLCDYALV